MTNADQRSAIEEELERSSKRVRDLLASYSNEQWQRKPADAGWSAIECVKHLAITSEKLIPKLTKAIQDAPVKNGNAKFHFDWIGWMLYRMMIARSKPLRMKTPASFVPPSDLGVEHTVTEFLGYQQELTDLLDRANGKALNKVKIESPFREGVHYHVYSAFRVLAAHETRHLDQAERAARGF